MTKLSSLALAFAFVGATYVAPAHAGELAIVVNNKDSGKGSLRHALEVKKANHVFIAPFVKTIRINSTLEYSSKKALTLVGTGQTIKTNKNVTLLAVTNGANLTASDLSFVGRAGFYSIENRGDVGETAGKGIFVDVRDDQRGVVRVNLKKVTVRGVANHGIHISDCSLADDCGGGSGGAGDGSPASIALSLYDVTVNDAGNGKFDADGVRVDDRGAGSIIFNAFNSTFKNVGADGVELDEGDEGEEIEKISGSRFIRNGGYCNPDLLAAFMPSPDEAEFDESEAVTEDDIPGDVTGSLDDSCFEREVDFYDSGFVEAYEFGLDLDDGIDIDEAGEGSLIATMTDSKIGYNLDEGVDFDEEDAGGVRVKFDRTAAFANNDDGFKISEEDEGDVIGRVVNSRAMDNGGKGIVFEEENEGDLKVRVVGSKTANNDDSDDTGIEVAQEEPGMGTLKVRNSDIADGIDTDGVDEI